MPHQKHANGQGLYLQALAPAISELKPFGGEAKHLKEVQPSTITEIKLWITFVWSFTQ